MKNEVCLRDLGFTIRRRLDFHQRSIGDRAGSIEADVFLHRRTEWSTDLIVMTELCALIDIHGMECFDAYEDIERAILSGELQVEWNQPTRVFAREENLPPSRSKTYTPSQLWKRAERDNAPPLDGSKLRTGMAARLDCSYLDGSRGRIDAPAELYRHTNQVTVVSRQWSTFDFPGGGPSPAFLQRATVNGRAVDIFESVHNAPAGYALPSGTKVVKALETLAPKQYEHLSKVSVNPKTNPDDVNWRAEYGDAGFSSAATAEIEQGIAFFPWKDWREIPQAYVDSTMNHEAGHLWSQSLWEDVTKKQGWLDAMAHDGKAPSDYARRNAKEDFAESVNMYFSSLGSPCEARGRENYPARYRYLDEQTR